jgi:hypothetical protein
MAIPNNPHEPVGLAKSDLRLLYAKLNALEAIMRGIIRTLADSSEEPSEALETLRSAAMEEGDIMTRRRNDPNPEFAEQGTLETLAFISQTFAHLKGVSR